MLSYQHEYHAGNHADVVKHCVVTALIGALQRKPAPLRVVDCHAGSGTYDLTGSLALRGREFESGISRVLGARNAPACISRYLELLAALNPTGVPTRYPGSPQLALELLRPVDQLELFELHPQAIAALRGLRAPRGQMHVHARDAYEGVPAVLPPKEHRGLVLIDPSYERRDEPRDVIDLVMACQRRWAAGVLAVWYPVLARAGAGTLLPGLRRLALPKAFHVELVVDPEGPGLRGSGLVIVNLPFEADRALEILLPWLADRLGSGRHARWSASSL